jgi:hypothetical protein
MVSRPWITVVTGLPRSGTSMMMQLLHAGGMPVSTDGVRAADEDNPRGYFELEAVKRLRDSEPWPGLAALVGKAVKIVCPLLYYLPNDFQYRVILMHRDAEELLTSQRIMLEHRGVPAETGHRLVDAIGHELDRVRLWTASRLGVEMLELDYGELVRNTRPHVETLDRFLGGSLSAARMTQAVDTSLYRCRACRLEDGSTVVARPGVAPAHR